jgi:hypothetical protein
MALLWIEGFEGFGTTLSAEPDPVGIVERKYSTDTGTSSNWYITTGRLGGYSLYMRYTAAYMQSPSLTVNATMVVGFAVKFKALGTNTFLSLYDGTTQGMNLRLTAGGEVAIYRGGTLLETTSGLGLSAGAWYYMEFKVLCANSPGGTYELRVGGVDVASDSGLDTQAGSNAYHDRFRLSNSASSAYTASFDDFYCLDGSGATNNDFLGNMRVIAIRPDADTAANAWTRSSGAENYDLVNEDICDDDTGYVESAVSTTTDLYDYDAVASIADNIKGIQINTVCRETDANSFSLVTVSKLGATQSNGAAAAIGTTNYITKTRLMETDPAGNAWTITNIDAAQFGIKVN